MNGTIAEINELLRVAEKKAATVSGVPSIRAGCRLTVRESQSHRRVADHSGKAAIAH